MESNGIPIGSLSLTQIEQMHQKIDISKSFPGVKALDDVHFELCSGAVMALLGENVPVNPR